MVSRKYHFLISVRLSNYIVHCSESHRWYRACNMSGILSPLRLWSQPGNILLRRRTMQIIIRFSCPQDSIVRSSDSYRWFRACNMWSILSPLPLRSQPDNILLRCRTMQIISGCGWSQDSIVRSGESQPAMQGGQHPKMMHTYSKS